MDLGKLYTKQVSFTEWFEAINHEQSAEMRKEDSEKRERLRVLNEIIGLPFDKPHQFPATMLAEKNEEFQGFLKEHGEELCALRLNPLEEGIEKFRMRGLTINKAMEWFDTLEIDASKYRADFVPHPKANQWGTTFIVNKHGIQGEIIVGGHHQLTQGFHSQGKPIAFSYDFTT